MKRSTLRRRQTRRGFTLLEVLLVLAILGVIAAIAVPRIISTQQESYEDTTRLEIKSYEKTLTQFALKNDGVYPSGSSEEVAELLMTPGQDKNGKPIARLLDEVPEDSWGTLLNYEFPNSKDPNSDKPRVWSSGPNKQNDDGGGDDVSVEAVNL